MRNIIITGGELFNKGAQAMTFVAVDELSTRYPDHEILLLSEADLRRDASLLANYTFGIIGWYPMKFAKCQHSLPLRAMCMLRNKTELLECENIYRNCDLIVDISGYGLSTAWGEEQLNQYLERFEFAQYFSIPYAFMPQSFGPIENDRLNTGLKNRIQRIFNSARLICARENEGAEFLQRELGINNTVVYPDIVLSNKGIDLHHIYKSIPSFYAPHIEKNSVAIIPNKKLITIKGEQYVFDFYSAAINRLLEKKQTVYLIYHSTIDFEICKKIKGLFPENDRVCFLEQEINCFEYEGIVKQLDFVIASRFHAIVLAFKNGVPCISIGWATKYSEIMKQFEQQKYTVDMRETIDMKYIIDNMMDRMCKEHQNEKGVIQKVLNRVQSCNVFDLLSI